MNTLSPQKNLKSEFNLNFFHIFLSVQYEHIFYLKFLLTVFTVAYLIKNRGRISDKIQTKLSRRLSFHL